ncbi:uncharacterized protein ARMOST_17111 [Armillaria ostoyae]|uniref:Uncharacterized protein n=1 Tax=Armillaria ostoyae TaxID=47428 RepID=A0A284RY29_ARMOS|nr:uncharacterized protein ARMOST_17111 [Armillaria ostoyae]
MGRASMRFVGFHVLARQLFCKFLMIFCAGTSTNESLLSSATSLRYFAPSIQLSIPPTRPLHGAGVKSGRLIRHSVCNAHAAIIGLFMN